MSPEGEMSRARGPANAEIWGPLCVEMIQLILQTDPIFFRNELNYINHPDPSYMVKQI
jgi:hypothetical protein